MTPLTAAAARVPHGTPEAVAAVIPAYNEAQHIGAVVRGVRRHIRRVLVVDDGSTDATARAAADAGAAVFRHEANRGKGRALCTGLAQFLDSQPAPEAFVMIDADGQHDPDELPAFIAAWQAGARCVTGDRMRGAAAMPRARRWTNRVMSALLSRRCGQRIPDSQCGYRLVDAVLAAILVQRARCRHYDFVSELLLIAAAEHIPIRSVPVRCLYNGQASGIRPGIDTLRFLILLCRGCAKPLPPQ